VCRGAGVEAESVDIADRLPGRGLVQAARDTGADLLVLGAPRPGQAHALRGETARAALYHAPCPVLVARGDRPVDAPRTIAVGFDGSRSSRAAVALASAWAEAHHAALTVIEAWRAPVVPAAAAVPASTAEETGRWAGAILDALLEELPSRTAGRLVQGRADQELAKVSETVDLLVVGTGECTATRRLLAGSTADALMHRAACPVLVVPAPAVGEERDPGAEPAAAAEG
jgi:nucleotide-binding universal stress UspA family protein